MTPRLSKSSRIIAFDPGGTTGIATYTDGHFKHWHIGPEEHHFELYDEVLNWMNKGTYPKPWDQVVCERFEYRNTTRAGLELISREYIGVIKLWCKGWEVPLAMQNASQAKGFVKDLNLKRLGMYMPGDDHKHGMDAYRHLLYYMINSSDVDFALKEKLLQRGWTS